jgi:hypothetical protein
VRRLSLGPLRCQVAKLSRGKIRKRRGRTASPGSSFCFNSEGLLGNPHFPSVSLGAARQVWHAPPELSARILNSKLPGHPAGQLAWSLNPRQAPSQELVKISGSDPATIANRRANPALPEAGWFGAFMPQPPLTPGRTSRRGHPENHSLAAQILGAGVPHVHHRLSTY